MAGFYDMRSPRDLLDKLRHDYEVMKEDPNNTYAAFNFFVTAEHMRDWLHPGDAGKKARHDLLAGEPLLQVVSHLANGAKHFEVLDRRYISESHSTRRRGGFFGAAHFRARHFAAGFFGPRELVVRLEGPAASLLGSTTRPHELALRVLEYWEAPGKVP